MQQFAQQGKSDQEDFVKNDRIPIISTLSEWAGGTAVPDESMWDAVASAAASAKAAAAAGDYTQAAADLNEANDKYKAANKAWSDYLSKSASGATIAEKDTLDVGIGIIAVGVGIATGGAGIAAVAAIGAGEGGLTNAVDQWVDIGAGNQKGFDFGSMARDTIVDSVVWAISGAAGDKLADAVTSKCVAWFTDVNPDVLAKVNELLEQKGLEAVDGPELMSWIPANITRVLRYIPDAVVSSAAYQTLSATAYWTMDGFTSGFPTCLWESGSGDLAQAIAESIK